MPLPIIASMLSTLCDRSLKYFEIAKERFYDASSYDAEDLNSTTYAKELNKIIKQLKGLILPGLKKNLEQSLGD